MSFDVEWSRLAAGAATSLLSAAGGLLVGVWRWGRKSAQREQEIKDDYDSKIEKLERDFKAMLTVAERTSAQRLDLLVEQFKESFAGLRRQIDEDRLRTEQNFLRKDDFRDFREEYREDIRDLKRSIAEMTKK